MHCLMSSEEWHRKTPFTDCLSTVGISVPIVDYGYWEGHCKAAAHWVASGPQKATYSDGSDQHNAGDGNTQGSPSGDSHGLAYFHLRRLIPCRRK